MIMLVTVARPPQWQSQCCRAGLPGQPGLKFTEVLERNLKSDVGLRLRRRRRGAAAAAPGPAAAAGRRRGLPVGVRHGPIAAARARAASDTLALPVALRQAGSVTCVTGPAGRGPRPGSDTSSSFRWSPTRNDNDFGLCNTGTMIVERLLHPTRSLFQLEVTMRLSG